MSSLPVPVSPVIRTVESVGATLAIWERTAFRGLDVPTISSNIEALSISSRRATFSVAVSAHYVQQDKIGYRQNESTLRICWIVRQYSLRLSPFNPVHCPIG